MNKKISACLSLACLSVALLGFNSCTKKGNMQSLNSTAAPGSSKGGLVTISGQPMRKWSKKIKDCIQEVENCRANDIIVYGPSRLTNDNYFSRERTVATIFRELYPNGELSANFGGATQAEINGLDDFTYLATLLKGESAATINKLLSPDANPSMTTANSTNGKSFILLGTPGIDLSDNPEYVIPITFSN